jgi:FAD/FMN-containing dehydrogenase
MDQEAIEVLRGRLKGTTVLPDDPEYDQTRTVWNGTVTKRPAIIARCDGIDDVVAAVNFAREQALGVAVRGGGHHVAGSSLIEGGLVIDLSLMRGVTVDPSTARVRCEGGAEIGDLDVATQAHGLAVPMGVVSATGIAGLTLAGGLGWMRRKHGLSCDNLLSADVVTAEGTLLHASPDEAEDLFWALRGAGWDLGVVVNFEFQAHPVGPDVYMTFVTYPHAEGKRVIQRFRDAYDVAPLGVAPLVVCWTFPEADLFPKELWGRQFVAVIGPYIGPVSEGEEAMRPMRQLGTVLTDMSRPQPWVDVQKFFDDDYPTGMRYYWKSSYLNELTDDAIDELLRLADERPSPLSSIDIWPLRGAIAEFREDESPLGHRQAPYAVGVECNWTDAASDAANYAFGRAAIERLQPFSTGGSYLNFGDPDDTAATEAAYGGSINRLRKIKAKNDPDNLFRSRRGLGSEG